MNSCNGDCNQGRQCDCAPDMPAEFPPFNRWTVSIALVAIVMAAAASAFTWTGVSS